MYRWLYSSMFILSVLSLLLTLPVNAPNPLVVLFTFGCFAASYMFWFTDVEKRRRNRIDRAIEKAYDLLVAHKHQAGIIAGAGLLIGLIPIYPLAFASFGVILALIALDHVPDPRTVK